MRPQSFAIELTRADYVVGLSALMGELARLDTGRKPLLFARLAICIATIMIIGFAFPDSMIALFAFILLVWVGESVAQAAFKTQVIGTSFDPAAHAATQVEFSEEAIVEQGTYRTRRWTWAALRRVHLPSGYVVIELAGWDMIILPDRLWPTAEERSAFIAELNARQPASAIVSAPISTGEAVARVKLAEPILMARIALAVAVFQLIFEAQLSLGPEPGSSAIFIGLAAAIIGGAIAWWASDVVFRKLAEQSPSRALAAAWGLFAFLAAAFALWFFRLI